MEEKLEYMEMELTEVKKVVLRLDEENAELKARLGDLENAFQNGEGKLQTSGQDRTMVGNALKSSDIVHGVPNDSKKDMIITENQQYQLKGSDWNRKRIVHPTTAPVGIIAFHAYLSHNIPGPLAEHHIIQFDFVQLNKGNGYRAYDGLFVVPASGTYVFTWGFMSNTSDCVYTQLMKNSDVLGTRYADS
ncbi:uncharacterized protein LOC134271453 [Saccostrea cucullata]|uniref:uncharacterized protein LOC134271453 n=1 Tax=Saccostrea cuccullata TaxID=36930 RepID=UPI002ED0008C